MTFCKRLPCWSAVGRLPAPNVLPRLSCEATTPLPIKYAERKMAKLSRFRSLVVVSCLPMTAAFINGASILPQGARTLSRRRCRSPFMCAPAAGPGDAAAGAADEDSFDPDALGVARMRASEIKAELDMRGVSYAGIFEKNDLVEKLIEARSMGRADPSILDDFNKDNLERKMDPEMAESFSKDLLDEEKLKDITAADGTLPGGLTPEQMSKFVTNPEVMVLMQNAKMQEVMKKVMVGGPDAMKDLQNDPETVELLAKLDKAMASVKG